LNVKAEQLIFVGYSEESKAYRLLNTKTNNITISRDVVFDDIRKKKDKTEKAIEGINVLIPTDTSKEDYDTEDDKVEGESSNQEDTPEQNDISTDEHEEIRRSNRSNKGVPPQKYEAGFNIVLENKQNQKFKRSDAEFGQERMDLSY
jgi:hypothetical protein